MAQIDANGGSEVSISQQTRQGVRFRDLVSDPLLENFRLQKKS